MGDLDQLLAEIARAIQPTSEQNARAESAYRAVGEWLAGDPELKPFVPEIYPQGSHALGTTNCPLRGGEHDVDLVYQMRRLFPGTPEQLLIAVVRRLRANGDYGKRIKVGKRCVRIEYAGDFHLDILPARPDLLRGNTCIEIPDRELRMWLTSNPRGYVMWFESQCDTPLVLEKRGGVPLPANTPADLKPILKRQVQLMKRHRDVVFEKDEDDAPRSIVLTTLSGIAYGGEASLSLALLAALKDIETRIEAAAPRRIVVANPTNRDEPFGDKFTPQSYLKFVNFVRAFRAKLDALLAARGMDQITSLLTEMFGTTPTLGVVKAHAMRMQAERERNRLRTNAAGLTTLGSGPLVRPNNFFGGA